MQSWRNNEGPKRDMLQEAARHSVLEIADLEISSVSRWKV